jgi:hypothetical protein
MELFLEAGQSYAFLLELIVDYLKLTDRNKVKLIHLSPVALQLLREPSSPSRTKIWG